MLIMNLTGCAVHSLHDRSYVSDSIEDRTGYDLRSDTKAQGFTLPDKISLSDGLTEDEAVAVAPYFKEYDFLMHWVEKPGTSIEAMDRITIPRVKSCVLFQECEILAPISGGQKFLMRL